MISLHDHADGRTRLGRSDQNDARIATATAWTEQVFSEVSFIPIANVTQPDDQPAAPGRSA